jgi:hypothetical protein
MEISDENPLPAYAQSARCSSGAAHRQRMVRGGGGGAETVRDLEEPAFAEVRQIVLRQAAPDRVRLEFANRRVDPPAQRTAALLALHGSRINRHWSDCLYFSLSRPLNPTSLDVYVMNRLAEAALVVIRRGF